MGKISDEGISDFWISGQSLIKGNCHNSSTNDDIDMKVGPVTKPDKSSKTTSKIPDAGSAKVMFSVIVAFCFNKN